MTPFCRAAGDLAVDASSLCAVLSVRLLVSLLIVLLLVLMSLTVMLVALIDTAEQLLAEATTMPEQATVILVATKAALAIFTVIDSALRSLLCATVSIGQPLISRGLLAVLFVVDEVPALREMRPKVLNSGPTEAKCNVRPTHTRALGSVEFVLLPMIDL
jgi:hypothetical protein